jgi:hypothetical protein
MLFWGYFLMWLPWFYMEAKAARICSSASGRKHRYGTGRSDAFNEGTSFHDLQM